MIEQKKVNSIKLLELLKPTGIPLIILYFIKDDDITQLIYLIKNVT